MQNNWEQFHRFQEKNDWCGVAVIQMILAKAGIKKSQKNIAKDVFIDWYGVSREIMLAYLSRYFKIVNYKNNCKTSDISFHVEKEHAVVLNWWDDFENGFEDGHYSLVSEYNTKTKLLTLVDPSRERDGIWKINYSEFKYKWYDTLTLDHKIWTTGWMLWADLNTKR